MRGVCGGPENGNSDQISYFTQYCVDFGAVLYLFVVKESICESSEKIGPSVFVKKRPFKSKLEKEGALPLTRACSLNWRFQCHYHLDSHW